MIKTLDKIKIICYNIFSKIIKAYFTQTKSKKDGNKVMSKTPQIKSKDYRNGKPMFTDFYWQLLCEQQKEDKERVKNDCV